MMLKNVILAVGAASLMTACGSDNEPSSNPASKPAVNAADEAAVAQAALVAIQSRSIQENREFCGYVGLNASGRLVASAPAAGDESSCLPSDPININVITASYHSHAGFSDEYSSEVPSVDDVEGDEAEGIDGYVATPGGRLWYIDSSELIMSQLCGIGCLPSDPKFVAGADGVIQQSYTYDELVQKLE